MLVKSKKKKKKNKSENDGWAIDILKFKHDCLLVPSALFIS